jgi:hypothetical protein
MARVGPPQSLEDAMAMARASIALWQSSSARALITADDAAWIGEHLSRDFTGLGGVLCHSDDSLRVGLRDGHSWSPRWFRVARPRAALPQSGLKSKVSLAVGDVRSDGSPSAPRLNRGTHTHVNHSPAPGTKAACSATVRACRCAVNAAPCGRRDWSCIDAPNGSLPTTA